MPGPRSPESGATGASRREAVNAILGPLRDADRVVLGVLACERKVVPSALARLGPRAASRAALTQWMNQGIVLDAGVVTGFASLRSPEPEHALMVAAAHRPCILRALAERELLAEVARIGRWLAGEGSLCPFVAALYGGDMGALLQEQRALQYRSLRDEAATYLRAMLREAVNASLADGSLEHVWRHWATSLVEQVLTDALPTLEAVEGPYQWALSATGGEVSATLPRVLLDHALLRGDTATVRRLAERFPSRERAAVDAVSSYIEGDLARTEPLLEALARGKASLEAATAAGVMALVALLAVRHDPSRGALAKRLLPRGQTELEPTLQGWPAPSYKAEVARAIRRMLRRLSQPELERRRLSAHQMLPSTPSWATLIAGLAVSIQEADGVTRAAWAQRVLQESTRAEAGGYSWFARQAQQLARSLVSKEGDEELAPEGLNQLPAQPGELYLCDLIEPEPEWRRALEALSSFVENQARTGGVTSRRVAWYVDVVKGELARPALEEYVDERGWTRERRLSVGELAAFRESLPVEDQAVLDAVGSEHRCFGPTSSRAFEALIGHPRVFNGVRGRLPVEVVRGTCRVETRHEHGHLVVRVEPAGAQEGINIVAEGESRISVYRVERHLARLISLIPSGLRIPEARQGEALPILARLGEHVEIRSASLEARREKLADDTPCLRISVEAGAFWLELGVRPFGKSGRFFPPGLGQKTITSHDSQGLLTVVRHLDRELQRCQTVIDACPTLGAAAQEAKADDEAPRDDPRATAFTLSEDELLGLLGELRDSAVPCALEWRKGEPLRACGTLTASSISGSLRRIKGWYLVNGSVDIEAVTPLAFSELLTLPFTKSGRFLRLPDGGFLEVERRVRQALVTLAGSAVRPKHKGSTELKLAESAFAAVEHLVGASHLTVEPSAREELDRVKGTLESKPTLPANLKVELRPYQVDGFRWLSRMSRLGLGVCLADDMGLGKTIQVLALLLERRGDGPALVVAPTSVCHNWIQEIERCCPTLRAHEYTGKHRDALLAPLARRPGGAAADAGSMARAEDSSDGGVDVLVASYALLQQDAQQLAGVDWSTVVLDEAQAIKNPRSQRARAAFSLLARFRVALSGTPVENHLGELWSIFHFTSPHLLGTLKQFRLAYLKPTDEADANERRQALKRIISPFLLRRRKDEVLRELPPITTLRHEIELSPDEALRYGLLRRQIHEKLRTTTGKRQHKLQILAEITRLRRFCCHPRLVFPEASGESAKLDALLELVEELRENGHRALIFSQFVDFLELARERLDERGLRYLYLDGSTPKELRPGLVRAFQQGDAGLFLVSLKAGGFGLNLTAADYVIHLDPWWNPAVEAQATDRAHRIGQHKPVTVYRLVTRDTIEENILALHAEKRALAQSLLEGSDTAAELDGDELLALIGRDPPPDPERVATRDGARAE